MTHIKLYKKLDVCDFTIIFQNLIFRYKKNKISSLMSFLIWRFFNYKNIKSFENLLEPTVYIK